MNAVDSGDRADFEQYRQGIVDDEDLKLLPVFFWVSGAVTAFFSLYFLIYLALGLVFVLTPASAFGPDPPPPFFGWMFVGFGAFGVLGVGSVAGLKILAGFWIRRRTHRILCLLAAGLSCVEVPYGTLLGAFTFLVLQRPSVQAMFGQPDPPRTETRVAT